MDALSLIEVSGLILGALLFLLVGGVWIGIALLVCGFVAMQFAPAGIQIGAALATNAWSGNASWSLAALPLFVFGTQVNGKVFGKDPDLTNLVAKNLPYDPRHDFRNVYSSMMSEWLGVSDEDIQSVLTASDGETYSTNNEWLKLGIIKSTTGDVDYSSTAPGLMLMQNYPNPVVNSTTFEFALSEASYVQLGIFDVKGNEVARVADGRYGEGVNRATFSAGNLANGTYLYRLRTDKTDVTRQLVIMK